MAEDRCADVPVAELALDLLDGRQRAELLAHVEGCPHCRAALADHRALADRLATLAPAADPPAGFEDAVLARLGMTQPASRRPPSRVLAWAAAAVLVVAVAVGAGLLAAGGDAGRTPPRSVTAALVTDTGQPVGDVVVEGHPSPWIYLSVHGLGTSGTVRCEVMSATGQDVYAGTFTVDRGDGRWSAPLPAPGTVTAARLLSAGGQVLASARLP